VSENRDADKRDGENNALRDPLHGQDLPGDFLIRLTMISGPLAVIS
jgi:hypothetical protein